MRGRVKVGAWDNCLTSCKWRMAVFPPCPGGWHEVVKTAAGPHGGSGTGNLDGVKAQAEPQDGQPTFMEVPPPLLVVIFVAGKDDKGEDV